MKNLAGNPNCDEDIRRELERCGIEIVASKPHRGEVPHSIEGRLGDFTFTRAWYYWVVNGPMPLAKAEELYADPVGKKDIRVAGHCGCPPPGAMAKRHFEGKEIVSEKEWAEIQTFSKSMREICERGLCTHPDPESLPAFVESYHVDSELGLYILARAIKSLSIDPNKNLAIP